MAAVLSEPTPKNAVYGKAWLCETCMHYARYVIIKAARNAS